MLYPYVKKASLHAKTKRLKVLVALRGFLNL